MRKVILILAIILIPVALYFWFNQCSPSGIQCSFFGTDCIGVLVAQGAKNYPCTRDWSSLYAAIDVVLWVIWIVSGKKKRA